MRGVSKLLKVLLWSVTVYLEVSRLSRLHRPFWPCTLTMYIIIDHFVRVRSRLCESWMLEIYWPLATLIIYCCHMFTYSWSFFMKTIVSFIYIGDLYSTMWWLAESLRLCNWLSVVKGWRRKCIVARDQWLIR